ncbi:hypothetical protein [Vaginella massiliensis]|uniref:hypothetical protein n=1 Tax=Vaginella massiliensis TaxID=1816680 RepID=UPI000837C777|nr:hypothetical protein [Vaginella massiliensis]
MILDKLFLPKKKITFINFLNLFLLGFAVTNAQETEYTSFGSAHAGLQGLELKYEVPFAYQFIFKGGAGFGAGYYVDDAVHYVWSFQSPIPFLKANIAWMYNKENRIAKGKSLRNNAGNFVALQAKYSFGDKHDDVFNQVLFTAIHWGIQRTISGKFYFNTHVGLGYMHDQNTKENAVAPSLGLTFGYQFF